MKRFDLFWPGNPACNVYVTSSEITDELIILSLELFIEGTDLLLRRSFIIIITR